MTAETSPSPASQSSKGARGRILRGFGAMALNPVVTAIVQLGLVPVLLHAWGAIKYGEWLLISAIPSYLSLSDLGFGDASGSKMAMQAATGDLDGALETFQSSWVLVTSVSAFVFGIAALSIRFLPWQHWIGISSGTAVHANVILTVLAGYVVLSQQNGVAESGYRSDGHFATGSFWIVMQRLAEALAVAVVALTGGGLLAAAWTYLIIRAVGSVLYASLLLRLSPWIHYGVRFASLQTVKEMIGPAVGFMTFPIGNALSFQGFTIVIGATLGPIAVVAFSTMRTLSRINFQVMTVIAFALWPELSRAFGLGDVPLARRFHRRACQAALVLSLLGGAALWIFGPSVYRLWLHHGNYFNPACFHVLLLVGVTSSLWYTSSVVPMSTNVHLRIGIAYVISTSVSLAVGWFLIRPFGITGAAVSLLLIDISMIWLVLDTALRQVQDNPRHFAASMISVPVLRRT